MADRGQRRQRPTDGHGRTSATGREEAAGFTAHGGGELGRPAGHGAPGEERDGADDGLLTGASVVLATVGRSERLARLVDAVLSDPAVAELVVVVDGADARSSDVLERLAASRPRLRPLGVPHLGQLGALDVGVRAAGGDVVVLLDDDVVPEPGTVSGHLRHHRTGSALAVVGPMPVALRDRGASPVGTRLYAAEYDAHVGALLRGERAVLDALWTGNLSLRRADCLRVGLASPAFRAHYHADRDLGYRLAQAGITGRFDPALRAVHHHERDDAAFLRDARRQGAGRAELHRAHRARLGPFDPAALVHDLPTPLDHLVLAVAHHRHAALAASALMAAGRAARRAGNRQVELAAAKLARRLMLCRGALAGEAEEPRGRRRSGRERVTEPPNGR